MLYIDQHQRHTFSPIDIPDMLIWLDGADTATITDAGGGAVSQWDDKSGNGHHFEQTNSAWRPLTGTRTLNGFNVVDFAGTDEHLVEPSFSMHVGQYTVFMVTGTDDAPTLFKGFLSLWPGGAATDFGSLSGWTITAGDNTRHMWAFFNGAGPQSGSSGATPIGTWTVRKSTSGTNNYQITDPGGTTVGVTDTTGSASQGNKLGLGCRFESGAANNFIDGPIAEVLVYATNLSDVDRDAVRAYLIAKWGA